MKQKKGLSAVISTVILIALVITTIAIVWVVVKKLVDDQLPTNSCLKHNVVLLDSEYTCFNGSSTEIQFKVEIKDVEVDKLVVFMSDIASTKSFVIPGGPYAYVKNYDGTYGGNIVLPEKNAGLTYVVNLDDPDV